MKVIVASFQCESNSRAELHPQAYDFEYFQGEDIFKKLVVKGIFEDAGFEVVPSIYANALPSGTVERNVYERYKSEILQTARLHPDADGVYLYVHGSMEVDGVGSGELQLLKELRAILKPSTLVALTMDLHANIPQELGDYADIVCGYKTAPHVDQDESQRRAAKALVVCLTDGIRPYTFVQKIPMLVKGDTMLTDEQPLKTLEQESARLEAEEGIYGANLFFGHCWVDAPNTAASAVVSAADRSRGEAVARGLANALWSMRKEFRFRVDAAAPEVCVDRALAGEEHRIFITDSGDNTTAGADGRSVALVNMFLERSHQKSVCVAGVTDPDTVAQYADCPIGTQVRLGACGLHVWRVKAHGKVLGWAKEIIGRSLTLSCGNVDLILTEKRSAFIEKRNFDRANADLESYRIVVVKLGYLFAELKPYADRELFALTDGASCVELARLGLKRIMRPMFPLEDFEWKA